MVPRHDLGEVVEPVAPEGEVDQEDEDEHEELEIVLDLTDLAKARHIHILQEEDASKNREDRGK